MYKKLSLPLPNLEQTTHTRGIRNPTAQLAPNFPTELTSFLYTNIPGSLLSVYIMEAVYMEAVRNLLDHILP